jgi:predicted nuclease of predicted toxin-antitoxin system
LPRHRVRSRPRRGIIALANHEGRIVITADFDFPRLLALSGAGEPALIVFRGDDRSEPELIAHLGHILSTVPETAILGHITVVDKNGMRHRRPIA